MGKILCATRGGETSWRSQDKAIKLAKERGDQLIFLYIVDISVLDKMAVPLVASRGSMRRLGRFLLAMAQERAREKGLETQVLIREGRIREETKAAAKELQVDCVVLGLPLEGGVFGAKSIRVFAREIEQETGAEVVLA